jgi:hypothetical protein
VIIVDNKSPDFRSVGSWNPSTRDKGFEGENYLWCANGDGSAHADFTPTLPVDGVYAVYVKWVAGKFIDRATNALFTVRSANGVRTIRLDISNLNMIAKWNFLGEFTFEAGKKGSQFAMFNHRQRPVL